eukprot:gene28894-50801_t
MVRFTSTKTFPPVSNNWGYFGNPEVDKLISDARTSFEDKARDAALAKLHARIVDDAPFVWIAHDVGPRAMSPKVKNVVQPRSCLAWPRRATESSVVTACQYRLVVASTGNRNDRTRRLFSYLIRRITYAMPIMLGVALVCFALVHLAPGDPLVSILPPDASQELAAQMRELYGFNRSYPEQFAGWVWRALQGDLGTSIASGRPVATEVIRAVGNTLRLAAVATLIGFVLGCLFGFVAGYF